jgi:hypothetical protein
MKPLDFALIKWALDFVKAGGRSSRRRGQAIMQLLTRLGARRRQASSTIVTAKPAVAAKPVTTAPTVIVKPVMTVSNVTQTSETEGTNTMAFSESEITKLLQKVEQIRKSEKPTEESLREALRMAQAALEGRIALLGKTAQAVAYVHNEIGLVNWLLHDYKGSDSAFYEAVHIYIEAKNWTNAGIVASSRGALAAEFDMHQHASACYKNAYDHLRAEVAKLKKEASAASGAK